MTKEEAIKILDDMYGDWRTDEEREALEVAIIALKEIPTGWIPVSERLPEKDKYKDFCKYLIAVDCTTRHNICDTQTAYFNGKHFYTSRYDRCFISGVKAWMPLPEPYKAESEEKE